MDFERRSESSEYRELAQESQEPGEKHHTNRKDLTRGSKQEFPRHDIDSVRRGAAFFEKTDFADHATSFRDQHDFVASVEPPFPQIIQLIEIIERQCDLVVLRHVDFG